MAEPTSTHSFFRSPFARQQGFNRRRSTRVNLAIPIVLSARDARGESFRELTQTVKVNLHGARLRTGREILVGMQVTIENPQTGALEKAVCVRVYESVPGQVAHDVAVQLVRPGNIWGLENPPEDWAAVAASMLGGEARSQSSSLPAAPTGEPAIPIVESQVISLEQQATTLTETVLQTFRQQIQALSSAALQDFQSRLIMIEEETANRLRERGKEEAAAVSSVIDAMREDAAAQLASSAADVVTAAEKQIRAKVTEILAPLGELGVDITPDKPGITYSRK